MSEWVVSRQLPPDQASYGRFGFPEGGPPLGKGLNPLLGLGLWAWASHAARA